MTMHATSVLTTVTEAPTPKMNGMNIDHKEYIFIVLSLNWKSAYIVDSYLALTYLPYFFS